MVYPHLVPRPRKRITDAREDVALELEHLHIPVVSTVIPVMSTKYPIGEGLSLVDEEILVVVGIQRPLWVVEVEEGSGNPVGVLHVVGEQGPAAVFGFHLAFAPFASDVVDAVLSFPTLLGSVAVLEALPTRRHLLATVDLNVVQVMVVGYSI